MCGPRLQDLAALLAAARSPRPLTLRRCAERDGLALRTQSATSIPLSTYNVPWALRSVINPSGAARTPAAVKPSTAPAFSASPNAAKTRPRSWSRDAFCRKLTPADLDAIAKECGPGHAATIAKRGEPVAPAEGAQATADASVPVPAEASELCELFFAAGGPERRLTLLSLDYAPIVPAEPTSALQRADIWRIESAALQHNTGVVVRELERALGVSHRQARRIVEDELGEPIVVAAKAIDSVIAGRAVQPGEYRRRHVRLHRDRRAEAGG